MRNSVESLRHSLYQIIYQSNTPAGRGFDIALILCILASVAVIVLDSVAELNRRYGEYFLMAEWGFTSLFTVEYLVRILCIHKPHKYIFSFYGIIDLLAIVPFYLSLFISGSHYLQVIRILRVLRVFQPGIQLQNRPFSGSSGSSNWSASSISPTCCSTPCGRAA